jgi:hypothetical protein
LPAGLPLRNGLTPDIGRVLATVRANAKMIGSDFKVMNSGPTLFAFEFDRKLKKVLESKVSQKVKYYFYLVLIIDHRIEKLAF